MPHTNMRITPSDNQTVLTVSKERFMSDKTYKKLVFSNMKFFVENCPEGHSVSIEMDISKQQLPNQVSPAPVVHGRKATTAKPLCGRPVGQRSAPEVQGRKATVQRTTPEVSLPAMTEEITLENTCPPSTSGARPQSDPLILFIENNYEMLDEPLNTDYVGLKDILNLFKQTISKKEYRKYNTYSKSLEIIEKEDPRLRETFRERYKFREDNDTKVSERRNVFVGIRKIQSK